MKYLGFISVIMGGFLAGYHGGWPAIVGIIIVMHGTATIIFGFELLK
jgi:hypothetical protein